MLWCGGIRRFMVFFGGGFKESLEPKAPETGPGQV